MSEYTKPKYKNLLKYLHDRNHYLEVDEFTAENRVELLSNFIMKKEKCNDGGKCFCSKLLKNVFFVYCVLTDEILSVGGSCKSLFTTRNKKKQKQQFLDRTLYLFKNNLGFERIIDWNDFIGQALDNYLKCASFDELRRLKELYKDNQNILDRIDKYTSRNHNNPTYPYFLDDIENDVDMGQYIVYDDYKSSKKNLFFYKNDYKSYWLKYLRENYHDRINILTIWYSKNRDVYDYIKPLIEELEKPADYDLFINKKITRDKSLFTDEGMKLYSDCWDYYLEKNYDRKINILLYWRENPKIVDLIRAKLAKIENER